MYNKSRKKSNKSASTQYGDKQMRILFIKVLLIVAASVLPFWYQHQFVEFGFNTIFIEMMLTRNWWWFGLSALIGIPMFMVAMIAALYFMLVTVHVILRLRPNQREFWLEYITIDNRAWWAFGWGTVCLRVGAAVSVGCFGAIMAGTVNVIGSLVPPEPVGNSLLIAVINAALFLNIALLPLNIHWHKLEECYQRKTCAA